MTTWERDPLAWRFRVGPLKGEPKIRVEHGCWIWQGHCDKDGYGHVNFPARAFPRMRMCRDHGTQRGWKKTRAHQLTYFLKHGNAPVGTELGHSCMRRSCCHWDHITPMTLQQNYAMKFYPPTLPRDITREIEQRIAHDEPYQLLADEYGMSVWNIRTMANTMDWARALKQLLSEADDTDLTYDAYHAVIDSDPDEPVPF